MMKLFQNHRFYLSFILYKPNKLKSVFILHKLKSVFILHRLKSVFILHRLKGSFIFKKFKKFKNFYKQQFIKNEKGQVIVEYILLLVVSTVLALVLIKLVTVDPDKNSHVFNYWGKLLKVIGWDIST